MSTRPERNRDRSSSLQVTQAGNQLLAFQSQQLSDLIAVISATGPADALTEAERDRSRAGPHPARPVSDAAQRMRARTCADVQRQRLTGTLAMDGKMLGHHDAAMPKFGELPVQAVAARICFIARM